MYIIYKPPHNFYIYNEGVMIADSRKAKKFESEDSAKKYIEYFKEVNKGFSIDTGEFKIMKLRG